MRRIGLHSIFARGVDPAGQNIRIGDRWPFLRHQRNVAALGKLVEFGVHLLNLAVHGLGCLVHIGEIKLGHRMPLITIPLARSACW